MPGAFRIIVLLNIPPMCQKEKVAGKFEKAAVTIFKIYHRNGRNIHDNYKINNTWRKSTKHEWLFTLHECCQNYSALVFKVFCVSKKCAW